jgi:hypothetical protein
MAIDHEEYNWRFRDDSAALDTDSGYLAAENTKPPAQGTGTANRFRIRFTIGNNNSKTGSILPRLYVDIDGGGYNPVNTGSTGVQTTGGIPANHDLIGTQLLGNGTGTFETDEGSYDEDDGICLSFAHEKDGFCEVEFCVYIVDADVSGGETLTFRVRNDTTEFGTYPTSEAEIDVASAAALVQSVGFIPITA